MVETKISTLMLHPEARVSHVEAKIDLLMDLKRSQNTPAPKTLVTTTTKPAEGTTATNRVRFARRWDMDLTAARIIPTNIRNARDLEGWSNAD